MGKKLMRWALHLIHVFKYLVSTPNTQHSKSIFKKNAYFTYGRGFIRVTQSVRYFPISLCGICCINWLLQFNESTLSWHSYSFKLKRFFIKWQNWRMRKDFPRFFPAEVYKFLPFGPHCFICTAEASLCKRWRESIRTTVRMGSICLCYSYLHLPFLVFPFVCKTMINIFLYWERIFFISILIFSLSLFVLFCFLPIAIWKGKWQR